MTSAADGVCAGAAVAPAAGVDAADADGDARAVGAVNSLSGVLRKLRRRWARASSREGGLAASDTSGLPFVLASVFGLTEVEMERKRAVGYICGRSGEMTVPAPPLSACSLSSRDGLDEDGLESAMAMTQSNSSTCDGCPVPMRGYAGARRAERIRAVFAPYFAVFPPPPACGPVVAAMCGQWAVPV